MRLSKRPFDSIILAYALMHEIDEQKINLRAAQTKKSPTTRGAIRRHRAVLTHDVPIILLVFRFTRFSFRVIYEEFTAIITSKRKREK